MSEVEYSTITYEVHDRAAVITMNRPKQMNAWTTNMAKEVKHAMATAEDDKNVFGIIITGAGKAFCAGSDMEDLQKMTKVGGLASAEKDKVDLSADPGDKDMPEGYGKGGWSYFATIRKPVIAAVNGPAAGIGMVCMLFCDMRFFGESGFVSSSFSKRGLVAEAGSAWILPKLVGLDTAFDILWSSRKIHGPEAKEMNLATKVFPDDTLVEESINYVNKMAQGISPQSVASMKSQLYKDLFRDPTESFKEAHQMMKATLKTSDFKEGIKSYMEGRKPAFEGIGKD